ncbi:MAG: hypothetical protein ACD_58C00198G0002 [uncultured bacterium]|nr:MAG: hypothetical protein ACD_58C00198G0002 [uncultured bacterium]
MNKSIYKQIGLGTLLLLGYFLIICFSQILLNGYPYSFFRTILVLILYWIILMTILAIAMYFIKEKIIFIISVILSILISLLIYNFDTYFIIGSIILLLITISSYLEIQRDIKSRIKIVFDLSLSSGLKKLIFPTVLVFALMFYYSPQSANPKIIFPEWIKNWVCSTKIPSTNNNFCQIPDLLENKIFGVILPGINPNSTIDDMVYESLAQSLGLPGGKDQFIREVLPNLPVENIDSARNQLINSLGLKDNNVSGSTLLKDSKIITNLIKNRVGDVGKSEQLLKLAYSLLFFEIAMFLSKIFLPLSIVFFWIFYQLMIKTKFIKIAKTTSEIERVEL